MTYLYLITAIVFEVIGTAALQASEQFTRPKPLVLTAFGYIVAFYFLSLVLRTMPVGIIYAVWSGAGIVLIMLVGAGFAMDQPLAVFGTAMVILIAALILGIIIPNQSATPPMRRGVELLEYAFVAAVLPLVFWVASLYSLVRGL